jgi:peptide/nickel transport system permease protein
MLSLPLLILIPFAVFVLMDLAPGDIATTLAGDTPTPGAIKQIRQQLRLNDPLLQRFWEWFKAAIHGDFGHSLTTNAPVSQMISKALGPTLSLVLLSLVIALVLGSAFGIVAGMHPKGWADRVVSVVSSILVAAPPFWVGLILVLVFALSLKWLPATGYQPLSTGLWNWLKYMILPSIALALVPAAEVARQLRGSLVDVLERDYVLTARAKGLSSRQVVFKHSLKNAAIPVLTVFGYRAAQILGTTVVVEHVFNIRGLGDMALQAVLTGDMPVVLAIALLTTLAVIVVNLITDLAYGYFNPKIREPV